MYYSTGITTIFMYLLSLIVFGFAVQYEAFFIPGIVIGALLFVIASGILFVMMRKRREIQDF